MGADFRSYARLVLRTQGARAIAYLGDFTQGIEQLRRATVAFLKQLPGTDRTAIARVLGISVRTVDQWARQEADGNELELPTQELRIYVATSSLLEKSGEKYVPLTSIVEHVKATVDRHLPTVEIWKRLEAYVTLRILEQDPEDPEAYRLVVRPPSRTSRDLRFLRSLLGYIFPTVFDIGYQVFAGVQHAHARLQIFDIPDEGLDRFVETMTEKLLAVIAELNKMEGALWAEFPDRPRKRYRLVVLAGPNDLDTNPFGLEKILNAIQNANKEETE